MILDIPQLAHYKGRHISLNGKYFGYCYSASYYAGSGANRGLEDEYYINAFERYISKEFKPIRNLRFLEETIGGRKVLEVEDLENNLVYTLHFEDYMYLHDLGFEEAKLKPYWVFGEALTQKNAPRPTTARETLSASIMPRQHGVGCDKIPCYMPLKHGKIAAHKLISASLGPLIDPAL